MRLAQFRRNIPASCDGIELTGPFDCPPDWSPTTFEVNQKPPHTTNPVHTEDKTPTTPSLGPKDYLDWIKQIPLAETSAHRPLSYMLPDTRASERQFEADTVPH